ncbi:MAG: hypothetical protein JST75_00865 [Bacteroidetes bacterium]|nr:hypothetical protein [Bacteroidota bacterium]
MKRLLLASLIIAGCFVATNGNAQVYVQARVNFGPPIPRVFCPPPAPVVVYNDPAPVYYQRECDRPVVIRRNSYDGYGYENTRYYNNDYRRNDRGYYRDDCDRDDREHGRGHAYGHRWRNERNW